MYTGNQVSHTQVDTSTFSNTLPGQNDRVPQIGMPRSYGNNYQMVGYITGLFRFKIQNRAQATPLHTLAYNLLSQNYFNNQLYTQWCQNVVDLLGVQLSQMGFNEQVADQAATTCAESYLGWVWGSYKNNLQQLVPQNIWQTLDMAASKYTQLTNQLNAIRQQPVQQQQMGFGQQNFGQQSMQMQAHAQFANNAAVGTQANFTTSQFATTQSAQTANNNVSSEGMYTMQPVETFDTGSGAQQGHFQPVSQQTHTNVPPTPQTTPQSPVEPVEETLDINKIEVDPRAYGNVVIGDKAYDFISVDAKTFIEPTFKNNSIKIIRDGDYPLPIFYDPKKYMSFTVTREGLGSYEKIVELNDDMEYLRHELNESLRQRYRTVNKDDKVVVPRTLNIAEANNATTNDPLNIALAIGLDSKKGLPTLVINDVIFTASSDMEVEKEVQDYILESMESQGIVIDESFELPVHEYISVKNHYLDVSEEGFKILNYLGSCEDLTTVATAIKEGLRTGAFSLRTYNFLNERLTNGVNEFIRDSLSQKVSMDAFMDDIVDLMDYFKERSERTLDALIDATKKIVDRAVSVIEYDNGIAVVDEYAILQTSWLFSELSALELHKGDCTLISSKTDEALINALKAMAGRYRDSKPHIRMIVVTSDGVRLELVKGHLGKNINMLKRL